MTFVRHAGGSLLDNLPLLTEVVGEIAPAHLPTLTEIVSDVHSESISLPGQIVQAVLSNEEELLLRRLEAHLENVFAHKLGLILEQMQRQAIAQAVAELKTELPELLRSALKAQL